MNLKKFAGFRSGTIYKDLVLESELCNSSQKSTNIVPPDLFNEQGNDDQRTVVKKGATLGANCMIARGRTIGEYAYVGAGAVVVDDVPAHALVVGKPARIKGWVCRCGNKLRLSRDDKSCCSSCCFRNIVEEDDILFVSSQGDDDDFDQQQGYMDMSDLESVPASVFLC